MIRKFECLFEKRNVLTGAYEMIWEYVWAFDEADARVELAWSHGELIDVVSCDPID